MCQILEMAKNETHVFVYFVVSESYISDPTKKEYLGWIERDLIEFAEWKMKEIKNTPLVFPSMFIASNFYSVRNHHFA